MITERSAQLGYAIFKNRSEQTCSVEARSEMSRFGKEEDEKGPALEGDL